MAANRIGCCETLFWIYLLVAAGLVVFAGLMAGLTLGLMSIGLVDLEVLIKSGRPLDRIQASKILAVVKNQHLLLCTLLIGNSLAMESLPIFLDKMVPPWAAVLLSVTLILMFGEILPQAVCSRFGMMVGATMAPFVRLLLFLFFPVAYPISKFLDWMLGKGHAVLLRRAELKTFVHFHGNEAGKGGDLTRDETTIITGALELAEKTAKDAMTPISKAFSLDLDATFDSETLHTVMTNGHSRVPVYHGNPSNIIGLILVKNLLMIDPEDGILLREMIIRKIPRVSENMPLYDILNEFQKGQSHIAVVFRDPDEARCTPRKVAPAGKRRNLGVVSKERDGDEGELGSSSSLSSRSRKKSSAGASTQSCKKRQKGGCYNECVLEVLPELPPPRMELAVGFITMEDVIEELLQEEILDEKDEYVNIHNRIKVNMNASQQKPSSHLTGCLSHKQS